MSTIARHRNLFINHSDDVSILTGQLFPGPSSPELL